jgi:hypothetical protein
MKNLKEYVKEGLFDDLDKIEKIGGMESNAKQLKKEIIEWICTHYCVDRFAKSKQIKKRSLMVDMTTTPPTVDYNVEGLMLNKSEKSLCNNGMFQWGELDWLDCSSTLITSLEGAPKKIHTLDCSWCPELTSLEGAPEEVDSINCRNCHKLESLEGCPKKMRWFNCGCCKSLKSLKGGPEIVTDGYHCSDCALKDLIGAPKEAGSFDCSHCEDLKSLKGCPKKLTDKNGYADFNCQGCTSLTSLEGCPKEADRFRCVNCSNLKELGSTLKDVRTEIFCKGVPNAKTLFKDFDPKIVNDFI